MKRSPSLLKDDIKFTEQDVYKRRNYHVLVHYRTSPPTISLKYWCLNKIVTRPMFIQL